MHTVPYKGRKRSQTPTVAFCMAVSFLLAINALSQQSAQPRLEMIADGKAWVDPQTKLRIHFSGSDAQGYDVMFETRKRGSGMRSLRFLPERFGLSMINGARAAGEPVVLGRARLQNLPAPL